MKRQCWANAQYSRRECLELAGIPRQVDDNQLETKVLWFFEKVGCKIDSGFIDACHRLGKNNEGVILKFARRKDCKQVVQVKNIKYFCVYIKDLLHVVFISSIFVFILRICYMLCLYQVFLCLYQVFLCLYQVFLCLYQGFVTCCVYIKYFCVYIKDSLYVVFISIIFVFMSRICYMLCLYQVFVICCVYIKDFCVYIKDLLYVVFISSIFTVQSFFLGISSAASLVLHFHCKTLFFP